MKQTKFKKGCALGIIVSILMFFGIKWMIKEAFSTTYKTFTIDKSFGKLIVEEAYGADMAQEFYDVSFKLILKDNDTLNLGNGIYHNDSWRDKIELIKIDNWYGIITNYSSHAKIGFNNIIDNELINFNFTLNELRNDSIWKMTDSEYPTWTDEGSSQVDSINENRIFVNYRYQLGIKEPFEFKKQQVQYTFDTEIGVITTNEVGKALTDE